MTHGVTALGVRRSALIVAMAALIAAFLPTATLQASPQQASNPQEANATLQASSPQASAATQAKPFDVLQLNLCHSGLADCFSEGEAIDAAAATIKQQQPAVVTLNEVCAEDITKLTKATGYLWEFTPAGNSDTGEPYQCADGRGDYGIAILSHPEQGSGGKDIVEQQYTEQDGAVEQRVMLCVPYMNFSACTTHLSADNSTIATKQCTELMDVATGLGNATVIGGDFNLTYGGRPDVQDCVPEGWFRKGDGSVQHVFATNSYQFEGTETLPLEGTDHPGLLVHLK